MNAEERVTHLVITTLSFLKLMGETPVNIVHTCMQDTHSYEECHQALKFLHKHKLISLRDLYQTAMVKISEKGKEALMFLDLIELQKITPTNPNLN